MIRGRSSFRKRRGPCRGRARDILLKRATDSVCDSGSDVRVFDNQFPSIKILACQRRAQPANLRADGSRI